MMQPNQRDEFFLLFFFFHRVLYLLVEFSAITIINIILCRQTYKSRTVNRVTTPKFIGCSRAYLRHKYNVYCIMCNNISDLERKLYFKFLPKSTFYNVTGNWSYPPSSIFRRVQSSQAAVLVLYTIYDMKTRETYINPIITSRVTNLYLQFCLSIKWSWNSMGKMSIGNQKRKNSIFIVFYVFQD